MKKVLKTLMLIIGIILALFVVLVIIELVSGSSSDDTPVSDTPTTQTIVKEAMIDSITVDTDQKRVIISWLNINDFTLEEMGVPVNELPGFEEKGILTSTNVNLSGHNLGQPDGIITKLFIGDEPIAFIGLMHAIEISSKPQNGYYDVYKITPLESPDDYEFDFSDDFSLTENQ